MLKVNLSRLDNMIRVQLRERQAILARLEGMPFGVSARIYEKSDVKDMQMIADKALLARRQFFALVTKLHQQEEYIAYLRKAREDANIRSGVSQKLQIKANLEERLASMRKVMEIAKAGTPFSSYSSVEVNELKSADFYKSAFTETSRICDIFVIALEQEDLEKMQAMLDAIQTQLHRCSDELATLNQETFVEIRESGEAETITV